MSRAPSEKTQLATAKRMIRDLHNDVRNLSAQARHFRARATQAEQHAAEWKERFDKLLELRKTLIGSPSD